MRKSPPSETSSEAAAPTTDAAKAESRAAGFMRSALAIIAETGRADFTVLEVVDRSKTSLRAFYQHYTTKDDLLLALIGNIMTESADRWRTETATYGGVAALQYLIERIWAPAESTTQDSINRGLTFSNNHLMETRPREFAQVMAPLHGLVGEILQRGIADGDFRRDLDIDTTAAIVVQTALGALRLRRLATELTHAPVDSADVFDFCIRSLRS